MNQAYSIVVTFNSEKCIEKCISSLIGQKSVTQKIIIIDNNSSDNTIDILPNIIPEDAVIIQNKKNVGFAAAVNQGLKYALENVKDAGYFFLLNPDAWLANNCLEKLISKFDKNKQLGLASPLIINPDTQKPWFSGAKTSWVRQRNVHLDPKFNHCQLQVTSYLTGCALLIKKSVIPKIGFFDERFFLYYEDADYSLRARKAGFAIKIVPSAACFHRESQSSTADIKNYHLAKSGLLFFHKHFPKWALFWFWTVFWIRLFYHKYISRKKVVLGAMKNFRKRFKFEILN